MPIKSACFCTCICTIKYFSLYMHLHSLFFVCHFFTYSPFSLFSLAEKLVELYEFLPTGYLIDRKDSGWRLFFAAEIQMDSSRKWEWQLVILKRRNGRSRYFHKSLLIGQNPRPVSENGHNFRFGSWKIIKALFSTAAKHDVSSCRENLNTSKIFTLPFFVSACLL